MATGLSIALLLLACLAIISKVSGQGMTFTMDAEAVEMLSRKINPGFDAGASADTSSEEWEDLIQRKSKTKDQKGQIFAVLVAGSNGFFNYRHQADICHAYQILHRNGVPDENIVVMMYDDIANATENITPGVIINRPNGSDVYAGVPKDYVGESVTPEIFLKVLLGDEEGVKGYGSGKVLKSGPNDHVVINFADHGAPGLVAFPSTELHARDLENTLKKMHKLGKYGKLVFYLEACESGSMFQNLLPKHYNIFATTAANSEESSYACYYDEQRNTYLGDVYSVMWMENSEQVDLEKETLQKQFLIVQTETNTSHVQEFGDKRLQSLFVSDFLGSSTERISYPPVELNAVNSRDVPRILLEKQLARASELQERKDVQSKLNRFHKMRSLITDQFIDIISGVTFNDTAERSLLLRSRYPLHNFNCYEAVTKFYSKNCYSIAKNPYVMEKLYIFVNMCERGWKSEAMIEVMANTCHPSTANVTGIQ